MKRAINAREYETKISTEHRVVLTALVGKVKRITCYESPREETRHPQLLGESVLGTQFAQGEYPGVG